LPIGATRRGCSLLIQGTTTDDEVYCQFLRTELYRFSGPEQASIAALVNNPDFNDGSQNFNRRSLLFQFRYPLLAQLPNPLEWHSAKMQTGDLEKLRLIRRCGWDDKALDNLVGNVRFPTAFDRTGHEKIAAILERIAAPDFDKTLLLVAKTTDGPFTILDGNHRATAMMVAKLKGAFAEADVNAYVGVSPRMGTCIWCA
jgi:hypothetical protein